jgi:hypothetical protein
MMSGRLLFVALVIAGCSEDPGSCGSEICLFKERTATQVETILSSARIVAGESVTVSCLVRFDDDSSQELAPPDIDVAVTPEVALAGASLAPTQPGTYAVRCALGGTPATPATLVVDAAPASRSITTVDPSTIRSGEKSTARCAIEDRFGNRTDVASAIDVDPSRGVAVNQLEITGTIAGAYVVSCDADPGVEQVPATLTVTPGDPDRLVALPDPTTATAGDRIAVRCELTDAAGNAITTVPVTFDVTPAPAARDDQSFTPTTAGLYDVTCAAVGGLVSAPVRVTIIAGPPATIEILTVDPALPVYPRATVVELTARVTDAYGNETGSQWGIESVPIDAAGAAGLHRVTLTGNGSVELHARVASDPAVEDVVVLLVDGDLPIVVIDSPARGAIIQGTPGQPVFITGHATDPTSGIASLTIEGAPIPVASDGSFSAVLTGRWGINVFEGLALDEAGNERMFGQSFELASSYRRARDTRITSGRIDDGLMVRLSQAALDDNTSSVDDLATLARLAIQNADLVSLIPNPVTTYNSDCSIPFVSITGSLRLHVDDVTFGTPNIQITAINGGLHLRAEIPNLSVDMHTTGDVCDIGIGVSGTASANLAVVEGDLQVVSQSGGIVVTMPTPSVQLSGFSIDLNLPSVIDWAVDGIISLFAGAIADRVESALATVIRNEVPPVVDDFLSSLSFGTSIQLPAPISISLGIDTRLGSAAFAPGGGNLGFDTTIYSSGVLTPEPLGGILQESVTAAALSGRGELVVGLAYDLLNQALYSMWYGGGLALDLTDFVGAGQVQGVNASGNAMLPLVLAPGGNAAYPVELAVGDFELSVDLAGVPGLPPIAATIYASVIAEARVSINASGELELEMAPSPRVVLDFATGLDPTIDLPALVAELEVMLGQLIPELFNQGIQGVPIPTLDLSSLAGTILPSGIRLGLGNPQVEVQASYLVLGGNVVQVP